MREESYEDSSVSCLDFFVKPWKMIAEHDRVKMGIAMEKYALYVDSYFTSQRRGYVKSFEAKSDEDAKKVGEEYFKANHMQCDTWVEVRRMLGGPAGHRIIGRFKRPNGRAKFL